MAHMDSEKSFEGQLKRQTIEEWKEQEAFLRANGRRQQKRARRRNNFIVFTLLALLLLFIASLLVQ